MKRFFILISAVLGFLLTVSTSGQAATINTTHRVYSATFVDPNGYSTRYQLVCFTSKNKAVYVNVDGINENQEPLFNDNHQPTARQLHRYLTSPRQRQRAAKNGRFTIKGHKIVINNGLVNRRSAAKIEDGGSSSGFTARYPEGSQQRYQTVVFKLAPRNYQYQ